MIIKHYRKRADGESGGKDVRIVSPGYMFRNISFDDEDYEKVAAGKTVVLSLKKTNCWAASLFLISSGIGQRS